MYIEMTAFTIPSFIITLLKILVIAGLIWYIIGLIGITIYWFGTGRK
jgi:ABC-type xylose transport system permease subunit